MLYQCIINAQSTLFQHSIKDPSTTHRWPYDTLLISQQHILIDFFRLCGIQECQLEEEKSPAQSVLELENGFCTSKWVRISPEIH
jgi:hypothetical protein